MLSFSVAIDTFESFPPLGSSTASVGIATRVLINSEACSHDQQSATQEILRLISRDADQSPFGSATTVISAVVPQGL